MFGHNSFTHPFEAPNGWMQPTETFTAEEFPTIFDEAPDAGKEGEIVEVRWDESADCGPTDEEVGGYRLTFIDGSGGCTIKDAAWTVNWLRTVRTRSKGQGVKFISLSPADKTANCAGGCDDNHRKTTAEGCCDTDCKDGYEFDGDNKCVEPSFPEEKGTNWLLWGGIAAVGAIIFIM